jgi:hypothetical protein
MMIVKAQWQHILDGQCLTKGELESIKNRFSEIDEVIDECLPLRDMDILMNLHSEMNDLLQILNVSLENHPGKEIDV